ncbi:MAG: CARDB domain-containing protein, partial [Candidatus Bathyarchaeia archaeon]
MAVQVSITQLSGQSITQGQTHMFYINIQIDTGEMIPINKVRITVTGPTSFTYEFPAASGGTDTFITLNAPVFTNFGYGPYYGYGYGYFPGYGWGFGSYPYGYGYGFHGPQTITWQAILKNTASLPTGTYKMTAEVESDGVWWGGPPTEVTFTIMAAPPPPPPPPPGAPDLTIQFVDLPTEFQATRTYDIKMQIKNIGTANAGAFNVTLTANGTLINGKFNVPSLAAGEQINITVEWTPATEGNYNLFATVDSDGDIAESNEANNTATTTVTVGVFVPTPAEVEEMTDAEAAEALERLSVEQATAILEQVSVTKCARVLLAMDAEFAARVLLAMDPDLAASIVEEMVDINASGAAAIIEEATAIDIDATVAILELMDTEHLARLIIAIINLPSTPQVAAQLLEEMSLEKAVDVVKVIVELGAQEDLAKAFPHLTTERLYDLMETLTVQERGSFLPYMTSEDIERIEPLIEYSDLTITSIEVTPEQPHAEEAVTVTVTVKNIGKADVNVFTVRLSVNGVTLQTLTVDGLTVDQTRAVSFSWTPAAQGTYTLTAVVDPENAVEELVETNNELSTSVTVLPKLLPDLTATFTSLPSEFIAETQYTITVTINNIGTASAGQFTVELRANNALVGTQT